jgi:hypothetical protein
MSSAYNETQAFHAFLGEQIAVGTEKSPDDLLIAWKAQRREFDAATASIRAGLEDVAAGRTKSLEEFDRDFRQRHNISPDAK